MGVIKAVGALIVGLVVSMSAHAAEGADTGEVFSNKFLAIDCNPPKGKGYYIPCKEPIRRGDKLPSFEKGSNGLHIMYDGMPRDLYDNLTRRSQPIIFHVCDPSTVMPNTPLQATRGPGGSAGAKRRGERIGVVNYKGNCVYIVEKRIYNTSPRNLWRYPRGVQTAKFRESAAVRWRGDIGRWEFQTDYADSFGSIIGAPGVFLYELAAGSSGFFIAVIFFPLFAAFIGFMIYLGRQARIGIADGSAIAGSVMMTIVFVLVTFFLMAQWGDVLEAKKQNTARGVELVNKNLDQLQVPGKPWLKPGATIRWPAYGTTRGFVADITAFFGGLAMLVWVVFFTPFLLWLFWTYRWDIVTGFYDAFVPSRNAALYEKDRDKPIGAGGVMRSMDVPSVDDILSGLAGSFTAPFKAAAARNQARKSDSLADRMRAQKEQLDAEADLFDAAADREESRIRKQAKAED